MKYCPFNILDLNMTSQKLANWDWLSLNIVKLVKTMPIITIKITKWRENLYKVIYFTKLQILMKTLSRVVDYFRIIFFSKQYLLLCYIANDSFLLFLNYFARAAVLMWPIFLFITRLKHFLQKTSCFQNFCDEFQYSVQSCIQNPVKRLKWSFLRNHLTAFSRAKSSILDVWKVSECLSTVIMLLLENQIFIWETVSHGMYRSKFVYMTNQYPNAKLTVWENTLSVKYRS